MLGSEPRTGHRNTNDIDIVDTYPQQKKHNQMRRSSMVLPVQLTSKKQLLGPILNCIGDKIDRM